MLSYGCLQGFGFGAWGLGFRVMVIPKENGRHNPKRVGSMGVQVRVWAAGLRSEEKSVNYVGLTSVWVPCCYWVIRKMMGPL